MRNVQKVILRAIAITALTGLTIGGSARLSNAYSGYDTGAAGYHGTTTGAGAGGSVDNESRGTQPFYRDLIDRGTGISTIESSGSGSGTGGYAGSTTTAGTEPVYIYVVDQGSITYLTGLTGSGAGGYIESGRTTGTDPFYKYAVDRGTGWTNNSDNSSANR